MNHIQFHRTVRAVERESYARGYRGDIFTKYDDIPLVGTLDQQLQIAALGCDTSPGPMSTRDRELHNRFVRAVVLTAPPQQSRYRLDNNGKLARERRRVG